MKHLFCLLGLIALFGILATGCGKEDLCDEDHPRYEAARCGGEPTVDTVYVIDTVFIDPADTLDNGGTNNDPETIDLTPGNGEGYFAAFINGDVNWILNTAYDAIYSVNANTYQTYYATVRISFRIAYGDGVFSNPYTVYSHIEKVPNDQGTYYFLVWQDGEWITNKTNAPETFQFEVVRLDTTPFQGDPEKRFVSDIIPQTNFNRVKFAPRANQPEAHYGFPGQKLVKKSHNP